MTDSTNAGDDERDLQLIEELRHVVEIVDPVPARVLDAARGSFAWRTIDAELAEIAYDSAADADAAALVRSSGRRLLTFDAPGVSVELEVLASPPERRLVGQLVPPRRATIEIRHPGGTVTLETDELGRFTAERVEHGPVSLVCRIHDATPAGRIVTDWLVI